MTVQQSLLVFAAIVEVATGVALILLPSSAGQLLLGTEISSAAVVFARLAGIGLFSLGLACWPGKQATRTGQLAILTYNLLILLFLLYVGVRSEQVGVLLWPAVALHAVLSVLLVYDWLAARRTAS
jgi:hypothetical protein